MHLSLNHTPRKLLPHSKLVKKPKPDRGNGFSDSENRQLTSLGLDPKTLKCLHRKEVQFTTGQAQYSLALLAKKYPHLKLPANFYKDRQALVLLNQAGLIDPGDRNKLEKIIDKTLRQLSDDINFELSRQARDAWIFFSRLSLASSNSVLKLIEQRKLPVETKILVELKEAQKERSYKAKNQKSTKGGTCKSFRQHKSQPRAATKLAAVKVPSPHSDKTPEARTFIVRPVHRWVGRERLPVTTRLTPHRPRPAISMKLHLADLHDEVFSALSMTSKQTTTDPEPENYWCSKAEQLNAAAEEALRCAPWLSAFSRIKEQPSQA